MRIDAHHHLWRIGSHGQVWPGPDLAAIYRDFDVHDLKLAMHGLGIDGTVLVQSQPSDADTEWLLRTAADEPLIRGVVGWTDLTAPDAPGRIAWLAAQPKLKGLRPMLQGLADDAWILREEVRPALKAMIDHDLTLDALVFPRHLAVIDRLAFDWPELAIAIDHGGKPAIGRPAEAAAWRAAMSVLGERGKLCCKLSGLVTEMADGQALDEVTAYADHLYEVFGPDRLMWGSDWPVVNLRSSYRGWFGWTHAWLGAKPGKAADALLGATATRFYHLH